MKFIRNLIFYLCLIFLFGVLIYILLRSGMVLDHPASHLTTLKGHDALPASADTNSFLKNLSDDLPRLLLQIILILATSQFLGSLFKKWGQPAVIGEIVAGIILGPSLLGLLFPHVFHFIFPVESLSNLRFLSQIGLILFMYIVGMELDGQLLRKQAFDALIISHSSILIPFTLGIGLSMLLYQNYSGTETSFLPFALFMGIAMSVTAFPVLARIIRDQKLSETKLGILVISCAASDDITAWCLLAVLVAFIRSGSGINGLFIMGMVVVYIFFMLVPLRLLLKQIKNYYEKGKIGHSTFMSILFIILLFSSYCTEVIGIHALFGAFLAGVIMPKNDAIRKRITERISDVGIVMLLPLFFVYTGLRTQVGMLNSGTLWLNFSMILICAVAGKLGGSALVARLLGQTNRDSLSIGVLMNTRGLMELIVLNIGFDLGILSTSIFSMMVLMALITTMMTSPILRWIGRMKD